ncbi:MAG: hypothetical protein IPJ41_05730 [Phycisphaerales bacterium]|nr:hypothetical protein [Phycisphaerales bacterium]
MGEPERALATLRAAHVRFPRDTEILSALVDLCRRSGLTEEASGLEADLVRLRG